MAKNKYPYIRTKGKDKQKNTFNKYGKYTSKGIRIQEANKAKSLENNQSLEKLAMTFGTPGIGPEGTLALSKWLANNTTLTILDLTDNNLGNEGAVAISNALTSGFKALVKLIFLGI